MTADAHSLPGTVPDAAQRRRLAVRAHHLKACLNVGRGGLTEAVLQEIRQAFGSTDLIKVRIRADNAAETDEVAAEMASRVPCHLVRRVGRVIVLYRPIMEGSE